MKRRLLIASLLPAIFAATASASDDCCAVPPAKPGAAAPSAGSPAAAAPSAHAGHALRGVIVAVLPEKSALLVKHEEIPGVMAAMTMLLKVDAATLAEARKDQAIAATLLKKPDGWWLENVRPAEPSTTP